MSSNPYAPPATTDLAVEQPLPEVPKELLDKIKGAWVAGLISGVITLAVTLFAIAGSSVMGFDAWNLIDVALLFGLSFGIYKKSRTCAVLMLLYFIASKILIALEGGKPTGILMSLVFIYYFGRGVMATFAYHKLIKR